MNKKYQVFVSSTYRDLIEERREVIQALLELDCIPVGMELFPAADDDQWTLIEDLIKDCDYYILILAGRYGSLTEDGISYTRKEYEFALKEGIPIISFLHEDPTQIASGKVEMDPEAQTKLAEFKTLAQKKLCKTWTNAKDLGSVVSRSLIQLIKRKPRVGWVKADIATSEESLKEILELREKLLRLETETSQRDTVAIDTSDLKQDDDTIEIELGFLVREIPKTVSASAFDWDALYLDQGDSESRKVEMTWNQLFEAISPLMINEAEEIKIQGSIESLLLNAIKVEFNGKQLFTPKIETKDFHTILVQFAALNYIKKSTKQRSVKDVSTYWTLTNLGEKKMYALKALRR